MPIDDSLKIRELSPAELAERAATCPRVPRKFGLRESAMEQLKAEGYLHWRVQHMLKPQDPEFAPVLLELFQAADPADMARRLSLARELGRLEVVTGQDFIIAQLQNPDPQVRWQALLNWDIEKCPPRNAAEVELLVSLLRDSDTRVRDQALGYCCAVAPDRAIEYAEKWLQDVRYPRRGWILFRLFTHAGFEKYFNAAAEFLRQSSTADDTEWAVRAFCEAVQKGPAALAVKARVVIEDFYVHSPNKFKNNQSAVRSFVEIAGPDTLPALQAIAERAADGVSRGYALEAIARQNPALALQLIVSHVKQHYLGNSFLRAFQVSASEQDWDALVTIVLNEFAAKTGNPGISNPAVDLLLDHGGERGRAFIEKEIPRLWPPVRMHTLWKLNRWTIQEALSDMKNRGLIDSLPDPALIEKIRAEQTFPAPDSAIFHDVLRQAGILRQVPSDSEIGPVNHCDLLAIFSQITDGVFAPQYCRQVLAKRPVEDPEFTASLNRERAAESLDPLPTEEEFYQVSFVIGNLVFEFETSDSQRHYAVSAVCDAVAAALERTPQPKRLVQPYSEDCFEFFFWGDPVPIRDFCRAYSIPLLEDFKSS